MAFNYGKTDHYHAYVHFAHNEVVADAGDGGAVLHVCDTAELSQGKTAGLKQSLRIIGGALSGLLSPLIIVLPVIAAATAFGCMLAYVGIPRMASRLLLGTIVMWLPMTVPHFTERGG